MSGGILKPVLMSAIGLLASLTCFSTSQAQEIAPDPCSGAMNGRDRAACLTGPLAEAQAKLDDTLQRVRSSHLYASDIAMAHTFEISQANWTTYVMSACDPLTQLYDQGDLRFSATADCRLIMIRDRYRLVETVYNSVLHH